LIRGRLDSGDAYPTHSALLSRLSLRAAHDLNNLIAVISGNAYLLRQSGGAAGDAESLQAIHAAVAGLERLSKSLSAVGAAHGPAGSVDVNALVREVAAASGAPAPELDLANDLPAVMGSLDALRAALRALLDNARTAAAGQPVRITSSRDADSVVLSVEDRGPGVTAEAAPRAFDPFFSTRGGGRGTGIGLFVAAAVAAAHGTSCVLEPREGGGTVASLRLKSR
jgi:two-component system, NtrC family, sensor kinase